MMRLTPTEKKLYTMLEDMKPHTMHELHGQCYDELAGVEAVPNHMARMRPKVRDNTDMLIISFRHEGITYYQLALKSVVHPEPTTRW